MFKRGAANRQEGRKKSISSRAGRFIQVAHGGEPRVPVSRRAWSTIEGYEAMHLIRKGQIASCPRVT